MYAHVSHWHAWSQMCIKLGELESLTSKLFLWLSQFSLPQIWHLCRSHFHFISDHHTFVKKGQWHFVVFPNDNISDLIKLALKCSFNNQQATWPLSSSKSRRQHKLNLLTATKTSRGQNLSHFCLCPPSELLIECPLFWVKAEIWIFFSSSPLAQLHQSLSCPKDLLPKN